MPCSAAEARRHADRDVILIVVVTGAVMALVMSGFAVSRRRGIRVAAEHRALRASEDRFRALVQNSSDMITVVVPDGTIRYQGPSGRRVLGHDPDAMEGTTLAHWTHPDDLG